MPRVSQYARNVSTKLQYASFGVVKVRRLVADVAVRERSAPCPAIEALEERCMTVAAERGIVAARIVVKHVQFDCIKAACSSIDDERVVIMCRQRQYEPCGAPENGDRDAVLIDEITLVQAVSHRIRRRRCSR